MSRKKVFCRSTFRTRLSVLASALALVALAGCGSTRGNARPSAATTTAGSQINETAQGLTVDNLVEYGYSIPHRYRSQGSGQLTVGARNVEWRSERSKRDFSIQGDVIKTATLQCASRPGQNVCLELKLGTVTVRVGVGTQEAVVVVLQIAFIPDLVAFLRLEESHRLSPPMTVRASPA